MAANILLVEDEPQIRRFVRAALEAEGWQVHESATLQRGLIDAGTRRPDLVVLDLGLPDGDGVDLIRDLRTWSAMPIIVLSARSAEASKIAALDAGADDYLVKPFGSGELMARVRAQLRRSQRAGVASAQPQARQAGGWARAAGRILPFLTVLPWADKHAPPWKTGTMPQSLSDPEPDCLCP